MLHVYNYIVVTVVPGWRGRMQTVIRHPQEQPGGCHRVGRQADLLLGPVDLTAGEPQAKDLVGLTTPVVGTKVTLHSHSRHCGA